MLFLLGVWFSSWYFVSNIYIGHIAQSPQSGPRWSPAFKIGPVLFPPSKAHCIFMKMHLFTCKYPSLLEKAMAPHSSTLAWKITWTKEPGRLQSMGSGRVGHD